MLIQSNYQELQANLLEVLTSSDQKQIKSLSSSYDTI